MESPFPSVRSLKWDPNSTPRYLRMAPRYLCMVPWLPRAPLLHGFFRVGAYPCGRRGVHAGKSPRQCSVWHRCDHGFH